MINFSSRTTSADLQRNLEASVEKRTKEIYGPPVGKRLLVFMDDLSMPKVPSPALNQFSYYTGMSDSTGMLDIVHILSSRWMTMAHNSLSRFWSCYWTEEASITEGRSSTTKSSRTWTSSLPWERQEEGGTRWIPASSRSSVSSACPSLQWSPSTSSMPPFSKATPEWVSHTDQHISVTTTNH